MSSSSSGELKRKRAEMEIVWQTPANPPERHDYIFRNGRRHVKPYYFEFISHVSAVKAGRIQVDGQIVPVSYIVQPSQKISHFLHRHEPPVMAWDVSIIQEEPDVLTVCKPASVPVHPCGQYRKNTVVGILQAEHSLAPLFPVHRLDRLVSGILILAKSAAKADLFRVQIEAGMVHKQYMAKVIGIFPEEEQVVNVNVNYNAREGRSSVEVGDCHGSTPLKGKAACTKFTRISTNGTHSIVLCEPITGRTHQIRVHLQYLGHPIANDMLYLSEVIADRSIEGMSADRAAAGRSSISTFPCSNRFDEYENSGEDFSIDPMCTNCPNLAPKGYDGHEEPLWLHCMRYSGPDWVYECPNPDWAFLS
ncbi:PREDICTED: RNA pseudouridine synthase 7 isoform X2 [Nelumbo nucifera]|uniref:RNA pseudouridine synthase 7 n=1 Tax=Nelumbo nucifera TaxID=4432 RepID=A0A1U7ZL31_NELNU|nr:PREDICTED: RNA pseudouridine synthase 7 isoform X2 [Nelumbo nucifera]